MWTDFQNSFANWFVRKSLCIHHKDFHFTSLVTGDAVHNVAYAVVRSTSISLSRSCIVSKWELSYFTYSQTFSTIWWTILVFRTKCYGNSDRGFWQHLQQPVDMFPRKLWGLDLTFNSKTDCLKTLLTLTGWLNTIFILSTLYFICCTSI